MSRTLIILLRRDPTKDYERGTVHYQGYNPHWPDGSPLGVALDTLCQHGQRLLGLGKHLANCDERLIKMVLHPLNSMDDQLTKIPGYRVRRFYMQRTGNQGCMHFFDGTPTTAVFDVEKDEMKVLRWLGLDRMKDGEQFWFDLAAMPYEEQEEACVSEPKRVARLETAQFAV